MLILLTALVLAVPADASKADTLPLSWWSTKGTRWTLAQARAALVTVPKIEAGETNNNLAYWLFSPLGITSLRGNGVSKGAGRSATWTRFEVSMDVDPLQGYFNPVFGSPAVTFCLHAHGKVKTTYPWTDWVGSGFRALGVAPPLTAILCKPTLANRQTIAQPFRG